MAADQRRKRSNGASVVSCGYPEQHRTKRKNLGLVRSDLAMKSHVSVEWDGNQQRVVAKREQIGISWRQMRPFANFVPNGHKILADVLAIPQEIFGLDNLNEVISYEVWNTHLSDNERNLLMQFLPSDLDPHQVVQEILSGDNFHFGNPFMKWGASLCSGDLHPDTIVNQEQHLKSDKRAYYSQLHDYHNDMIGFLMKLKRSWASCKDSENEIVEKTWRVLDKGFDKGKPKNLMVSSDYMHNVGARPKKGDKLHKLNIHSSDGDKYMSYIKISKTQHELFKSMKLSCNRIQSRTLNHVLGDLDNIHVQPYEVFIKEEQKKLHEHWLQLVNKDLPVAYANWKERLIQKHAMRNSLLVEMKDKSKPLVEDKDILSSGIQPQDQEEDGGLNDQSSLEDDEDSIARSPENHSLHNSYHSGDDELNHLSMDSEKNILPNSDDASQNKSEYSRIMNSQDVPISEGAPFSSDCHAWQAVRMPHSYYDSAVTHGYTANGLSQVDEEQPTGLIGLDSDLHQGDTGKELLHRQSNDDSFSSYPSQDRIDLLQSLFKGKGVKSYHHEQERVFQTSNNVMMGDGQLFSHFKEPSQTPLKLDQGQRRSSEVFIPENMSDNIYSDGGRYLMPRQDPLSAVNITDWAANPPPPPPMVAPSQSHVNTGDFIGQHWLSAEHQVRGGWNGSDGGSLSSQSLGTGGNSDQSLFSILSHCSQLRSGSPYESVRHSDQFLAPRTFGVVDASTPRINAVVSPSSHPLDYFSGREAPNALVPDDMAWMSLQPQNPALHDQMGKPYLRSWNR
ncbi:uncharacterized protein LOC133310797 [Gastrolobium bilobum]|uniref:uncharacterized protein LOC133310797 n=1 Tax=Gastrolobium bilobum TaxID=150636 RepID=UPI002AB06680|nr:uncharacterized protein LOC133310797 [Gastrolobium bilobum]XP_061367767.1 uncharacterized protein LOC133310797 [Gastrolobium bilobum]XP_061367769.1 uncharacterized protein LOC133310797 [Gastrolobium bilobum]